jgi:hypothetical protein
MQCNWDEPIGTADAAASGEVAEDIADADGVIQRALLAPYRVAQVSPLLARVKSDVHRQKFSDMSASVNEIMSMCHFPLPRVSTELSSTSTFCHRPLVRTQRLAM